jgi:hypothetical protein
MTTDENVRLVDQHKEERGLNQCLRATQPSKSITHLVRYG